MGQAAMALLFRSPIGRPQSPYMTLLRKDLTYVKLVQNACQACEVDLTNRECQHVP